MGEYDRPCKICGKPVRSDCADVCYRCSRKLAADAEARKEAAYREEQQARILGFKLRIELVPSPLWYRNVRSEVDQETWDMLRKKVYKDAGYRCQICGHQGRMFCHEIWQYDDKAHIQKLVGFEAICQWCHRVHHIGLAGIQLSREEYNSLIRHFKRVNGCSYEDFVLARDLAFELWEQRSEFEWSQDMSALEACQVALNCR
mgnify:CR=1 FL=1|jgi:hypothetical protein